MCCTYKHTFIECRGKQDGLASNNSEERVFHSSKNGRYIFFKTKVQQPVNQGRYSNKLVTASIEIRKLINHTNKMNWLMLSVRVSMYGYTRRVWRARQKRKSCSKCIREQLIAFWVGPKLPNNPTLQMRKISWWFRLYVVSTILLVQLEFLLLLIID